MDVCANNTSETPYNACLSSSLHCNHPYIHSYHHVTRDKQWPIRTSYDVCETNMYKYFRFPIPESTSAGTSTHVSVVLHPRVRPPPSAPRPQTTFHRGAKHEQKLKMPLLKNIFHQNTKTRLSHGIKRQETPQKFDRAGSDRHSSSHTSYSPRDSLSPSVYTDYTSK